MAKPNLTIHIDSRLRARAGEPEERLPDHYGPELLQMFQPTFEERADGDEGPTIGTLTGVAPPWNELSLPIGFGFREKWQQGAFKDLRTADVISTVEHNGLALIGRTSVAGTLRLQETSVGLRYQVDLPNTTAARDLVENVKLGNVRGSSFEFTTPPGGDVWEETETELIRTVINANLHQIGPVTRPAFEGSEVGMRGLVRAMDAFERYREEHPEARFERSVDDWREELADVEQRIRLAALEGGLVLD